MPFEIYSGTKNVSSLIFVD